MPPTKPARAVPAAPRRLGDGLWHGLGAGVAAASAGFATYALVFSTGEVVPSGDFNLFSRSPASRQAAGAQRSLPAAAPDRDGAAQDGREVADRGEVDYAPTGSLGGTAAVQNGPGGGPGGSGGDPGARRRGADGPALPNFTLRDVFDGKALVESRSSLSVVQPGSMLDGAGEVLSIEKRGERWIVLTRNGVIAGQGR